MSVKDWRFHDFDMLLDSLVKIRNECRRYPVVYRMTGLLRGSQCLLCDVDDGWLRKTKNEGSNGSIRYDYYSSLDEAMAAAIKWARRKDEEAAAEQ
jgi:hypothetical protein